MEVIGNNTHTSATRARGGSAIEIRDIIESGQKCSHKIGIAYVPVLQKPMSYTFQKNVGKDFISSIQKSNSIKLGPNHYKIFDAGGFTSKDNLKKVKFAFNKETKTSVLEQNAKKKMWVPSAHAYNPENKKKTLGNYLL